MFSQPALEGVLAERLRSLASVSVERGIEVLSLDETGDGAKLGARGSDGERVEVTARFAVGCDGANSLVREAIGAGWHDLGFRFDWLVVDLLPQQTREWDPPNWQLCDPARPTTLVSGGPGRRRFEFMRLPDESREWLEQEDTAWRLLAPWDLTPANAKLERHAVYTFRAAWAERWRRRRALIAGDAAHLMPPFAGQGMCSGLKDAANLAWKLDLVLAGRAPEALLDSYASERMPNARATIELSISLGRVICVSDPREAAERDARMIAEQRARGGSLSAPLPPLGPGCWLAGSPGAGALFVQGRVGRGASAGLFGDVAGHGFALLSPHADPAAYLPGELASWFGSLGGIAAHVAAGAPVEDLDGSYARWFAAQGAAVALQRPDGYVFGTSTQADGAAALVAALRSRLAEG
jgi:2-polyprenyl-6-methoxyphenol hydroxylase-like FAD-dependent oxidoreductase